MMQLLELGVALAVVLGTCYVLWRPHWMFVLLVAMFPLEQLLQGYVSVFAVHSTWFNYLMGFMAVVAVGLRLLRRDRTTADYWNPLTVLVLALYLLWTVGLLYTMAPVAALDNFEQGLPYLGLLLLLFPLLILDIFEFRRMLTGLMLLGSVVAVLIMANPRSSFYSGRLHIDLGMVSGIDRYGSPLALGELGGLVALIAALIRAPSRNQLFTFLRIGAFICGFGLAIGSGSRGQVLAAGICGVLFYPVARQVKNPKQFFINVIGFAILVAGIYFTFRLFIGSQNRERWDVFRMFQDISGRFHMVQELLSAYLARPGSWVFGLGPSAFTAISSDQYVSYVHNIAAEVLCEHGLVGFGLLIAMVVLMFRYGTRLWKMYGDDPSMRSVVALLLAICAYALFLALKQGSISYPAPFFWWVVLGKLYFHEKRVMEEAGAIEPVSETESASDDELMLYEPIAATP